MSEDLLQRRDQMNAIAEEKQRRREAKGGCIHCHCRLPSRYSAQLGLPDSADTCGSCLSHYAN